MSRQELTNRGAGVAKWAFPPVHPEGRKFGLIAAGITLFFAFMAWETLAWPMAAVTIWTLAFFRDPVRATPIDERFIVSPADGLVTLIEQVLPPVELCGPDGLGDQPMTRVSIFMSVFDVHINRTPIRGTITRVVYIAGKFLNADLDKASEENERQNIKITTPEGVSVGVVQIAGLVARRILCDLAEGQSVKRVSNSALSALAAVWTCICHLKPCRKCWLANARWVAKPSLLISKATKQNA